VCRSSDPRNQRLRPSILVETATARVLVDAPPDFRTQALRAHLSGVAGILITHTHADHVLGLDDLRVFCLNGTKLPVYGAAESLATLQRMFPYACTETPAWPGLPSFALQRIEPFLEFAICDLNVLPVTLPHGRMTVLGFVFGTACAYLTDCHAVPDDVVERARGVELLILDGLRYRPHPTHLTVAQALAVRERVQPATCLLTHLCHEVDHATLAASLPAGVGVAYDGLTIELGAPR
jgi:phosphoribosyl 1,2-cyclic phosphate phosphodiesterase